MASLDPVDELRPQAAAGFEDVFGLSFEELPADEGAGLWPQPLHEQLTARPTGASPASIERLRRQGGKVILTRSGDLAVA